MELGEAMAMRNAMRIAIEASFRHLVVEIDCLLLFHKLSKGSKEKSEMGLILHDINVLANQCLHKVYAFVRRDGNKVAHALAKKSLSLDELYVWL